MIMRDRRSTGFDHSSIPKTGFTTRMTAWNSRFLLALIKVGGSLLISAFGRLAPPGHRPVAVPFLVQQ